MNVIVLTPGAAATGVAGFVEGRREALCMIRAPHASEAGALADALVEAAHTLRAADASAPLAVAIYIPCGGRFFATTIRLDGANVDSLRTLIDEAPIHAPAALALAEIVRDVLPEARAMLVNGSGFFAMLSEREASYGLDPELADGMRRTGFHGLFHAAGFAAARHRLRASGHEGSAHVISLCLEPRPEVAGIIAGRPVMVTSGITPLEGLPGHTTCGEIDPSVVLKLYRDLRWGSERISRALTHESGLLGLAGEPITLRNAFRKSTSGGRLAGDVLRYRLLLAFGAAMAAMGRVDAIAVSGRFGSSGLACAEELGRRLRSLGAADAAMLPTCLIDERLDRLVADSAMLASPQSLQTA